MYLPEKLQEQSYVTWNHTVKGLMQVWEIANKLGLEQCLEERLRGDEDGLLTARVAEIGNDPRRLAGLYRDCAEAILEAKRSALRKPVCGVIVVREDAEPGIAR